jgi:hypothetical protein
VRQTNKDEVKVLCQYCNEPILEGELAAGALHRECAVRMVAGSVGHQLGLCSCHGGTDEDPPGISRREAARQALQLYLDMNALKDRYRALFLVPETATTQ